MFFFASLAGFSQPQVPAVDNLSTDRMIDWQFAGLVPDSPNSAVRIYNVNDYATVQAAINDAIDETSGLTVVYFPEGVYNISTPITLNQNNNPILDGSNILFQGDGSDKTILKFTVGNNQSCFEIEGDVDYNTTIVQSNISKGSKQIQVSSNVFSRDDWIHFYEEGFDDKYGPSNSTYVGQINQIASDYNSGFYNLKYEAAKLYQTTNNSLKVRQIIPIENVGIENLKIQRLDGSKSNIDYLGSNVIFKYAVNCWVKGVELDMTCRHHIEISNCSHIEVSGCFMNEARSTSGGSYGYGTVVSHSSTNCLIENNIFRKLRHSMGICWGANSNVFAYNYSREQTYDEWALVPGPDLCLHGTYSFSNLYEGNAVDRIMADATHGMNGPYNTFLRNRHNSPESAAFLNCHYVNFIGNDNIISVGYEQNDWAMWIFNMLVPWTVYGDSYSYFDCYFWSFPDCPTWNNNYWGVTHNYWGSIQDDAYYRGQIYGSSFLNDISYYYDECPPFIDQTNYSWPPNGPNHNLDYNSTLEQPAWIIPAEDRFNETVKTYIISPMTTITTNGTLTENENWQGNVHITGHVTVPTGITLNITPGTTVLFDGDYRITAEAGSEFYANGATFKSANDPATSWQYIKLSTSDAIVENCEISGADYGIFIYKSDGTIKDCEISDCGLAGIRVHHPEAEPTIDGCDLTENDKALYIIYADPDVTNNKMNSYSSYTIRLYQGRGQYKNNTIESRNGDCVYITGSNSFPHFTGQWDGYGNYFDNCNGSYFNMAAGLPDLGYDWYNSGGFNVMPEDGVGDYAVINNTGSTVYAELNWWQDLSSQGGYPTNGSIFFGYQTEYIPACSKPSQVGALWKSGSENVDPINEEFMEAFSLCYEKDYENAIKELRKVINKYPSEELTHQALFRLYDSYQALGELDANVSFLNSVLGNVKYDERSKHIARVWLMKQELNNDKPEKAEKIAFEAPEGSYSERELLLTLIAEYSLRNNDEDAQRIASVLGTSHRDEFIEDDIQMALETEGVDKEQEPLSKRAFSSANKKAFGNSPNPFNSSTRLSFS